jgi:hypothetical protein
LNMQTDNENEVVRPKSSLMQASKENARKARENLLALTRMMPQQLPQLQFVKDFLDAAERKLPTDEAYSREKLRKSEYFRRKKHAGRDDNDNARSQTQEELAS